MSAGGGAGGTRAWTASLPEGSWWDRHNVVDMNERGDVIGYSGGGMRSRSHLWRDGEVIDLAPFDPDNPSLIYPGAINDLGWIVGYQERAISSHGTFLWIDGEMMLLSDLIEPEFAGIELLTMNAIGNDGVIAGTAWINGRQAPVFLMPVASPGGAAALAIGAGAAIARRRR